MEQIINPSINEEKYFQETNGKILNIQERSNRIDSFYIAEIEKKNKEILSLKDKKSALEEIIKNESNFEVQKIKLELKNIQDSVQDYNRISEYFELKKGNTYLVFINGLNIDLGESDFGLELRLQEFRYDSPKYHHLLCNLNVYSNHLNNNLQFRSVIDCRNINVSEFCYIGLRKSNKIINCAEGVSAYVYIIKVNENFIY